jgi:hypothetical protein
MNTNEIKARIERYLDTLDRTKPQKDLIATLARKFEISEQEAERILNEINQEQAG